MLELTSNSDMLTPLLRTTIRRERDTIFRTRIKSPEHESSIVGGTSVDLSIKPPVHWLPFVHISAQENSSRKTADYINYGNAADWASELIELDCLNLTLKSIYYITIGSNQLICLANLSMFLSLSPMLTISALASPLKGPLLLPGSRRQTYSRSLNIDLRLHENFNGFSLLVGSILVHNHRFDVVCGVADLVNDLLRVASDEDINTFCTSAAVFDGVEFSGSQAKATVGKALIDILTVWNVELLNTSTVKTNEVLPLNKQQLLISHKKVTNVLQLLMKSNENLSNEIRSLSSSQKVLNGAIRICTLFQNLHERDAK
jgi:hypothetical protein